MMGGDYNLKEQKTIIHITIGPFPSYNAMSFCINQTLNDGIDVKVWDLTEMIGLPQATHLVYQDLIVSIKNKAHLSREIEKNKQALFVTAINPEKRFFWVYYYLAKFHCKHAKIANGWIREYGSSRWNFIVKLRREIKKLLLEFLSKIGVFSLPQHIFLPGYYWNNKLPEKPKIININHLLYDQFLELQEEKQKREYIKPNQKYILFLDEAHSHHPDGKICGIKLIDEMVYLKKMQSFFEKLEEKFQLPIIIAAHPKAKYNGDEFGEGIFGKRKVFFNKTNELARYADIFLAHFSTTRILPIIYNKPLYLIWLEDFTSYPLILQNDIVGFSQETGCPILEEKTMQNGLEEFTPNPKKYKDFLCKYYIARGCENINTLDIIGKKLVELAKQ